ncbi:hypothetical protein JCGZ_07756 [Jatropha curcas]|uniref:Uncharacterized protein n=1 Tax=Jatropha curcas TaxID=180498 RepID=A0A067KPI0_JATCU|nr:protein JINGUBANG [Jatropha curcas]KDP34185.1 hypothetical protein JCGZ_07756 [Jatropha curcas]
MEFYGHKKTLHNFMSTQEGNVMQSLTTLPGIRTHQAQEMTDQELQFTPPRPSNTNELTLIPPTSPGSPWTLSPLRSPSPSLLYHCIASLHRNDGNIFSISVSKGVVFTGSESKRIRAWRQPDCLERGYLKASSGQVRAVLVHDNVLFSAHKDGRIRIWNFTLSENFKGRKISSLPKRSLFLRFSSSDTHQHKDCVSCMAYYHAEGLLYTGSYDKTVKVWRVSDKKCVDSFLAHEDYVNAILVNQDDGYVFTCSLDGSVKIWRRVYGENSHTLTMILKFQRSPVNALAISSTFSNCFLYSGSSDGMINFWEKERFSGRFNHGGFLQGHRFAVLCLAASEKLIFSGSEDTTIRVWRREEGSYFHECLAVLEGHRGPVRSLTVCLEIDKVVMGFLVYSASLDHNFKIWRVKVMPEERICLDYNTVETDSKTKAIMEYEMSPVLSPSWVEKKRGAKSLSIDNKNK